MKNDYKRGRLLVVAVSLIACVCIAVPIALFQKQILEYDKYAGLALSQQTRNKIIEPERGTIFDTNMKELAVSANVEQVNVDPNSIKKLSGDEVLEEKLDLVSRILSENLDVTYDEVYAKLLKNTQYEIIASGVEKDVADTIREAIAEHKIYGIILTPDTKRYYPQGNLASNLIGFTGTEGYD